MLFIAESPPRREPYYFYNGKKIGNLKAELFRLLRIKADTALLGLTEFKEKGFFLIDTVKCRCDKRVWSTIPPSIVKKCAKRFLQREIVYLNPRKICVLGKTALIGLGEVEGFGKLKNYGIRDDCGKQMNLRGYSVVLCLFPSTQNKRFYQKIKAVFDSF